MPKFGAGTVTFDGGSYECEVSGGAVIHTYEERDVTPTLCNVEAQAPEKVEGPDSLKLSLVNDLTVSGFYNYLHTNDLQVATFVWTPNTQSGASWAGDVVLNLPDEIGAGAWGDDIESEVEFSSPAGRFTFTPEPDPVA